MALHSVPRLFQSASLASGTSFDEDCSDDRFLARSSWSDSIRVSSRSAAGEGGAVAADFTPQRSGLLLAEPSSCAECFPHEAAG